ncbi:dephospho-CoA kinase [Tunturiibacter lichenicola]|uniref:dephospho-CoA kinase n=1 Tax=Tunturiibacter lichenicola TaxID=2051959 RepID=UPI0021B388A6|nr:dephospho-CoA kinase [Edaphobacter lichenicola]
MLRIGLTGGLGSGKSTAARLFAGLGAHVLQSDAIGRELMEPGQAVYAKIAAHFGPNVVLADGRLDRGALARIAFTDGRVEELNAIVHPSVIAREAELSEEIGVHDSRAVVIVESALIFETRYGETKYGGSHGTSGAGWQDRFDRIILVTAPEEVKIARFVARSVAGDALSDERRAELEAEARLRIAQQIPDEQKSALCDYVLTNGGALTELEWQVDQLWPILQAAAR